MLTGMIDVYVMTFGIAGDTDLYGAFRSVVRVLESAQFCSHVSPVVKRDDGQHPAAMNRVSRTLI